MDKIKVTQDQWMLIWESIDTTLDANDYLCLSVAKYRARLRRDILDAIAEHVSFANYK